MVGDFVIQRSNGMPTYNFCCVVDDALMKITHVIRGEDHLNNTIRQLMIYEALGENSEFAHVSLLVTMIDKNFQKGMVPLQLLNTEQHFLPEAMNNYLCLLGWSHPDEKDIFKPADIASIFEMKRFSKSAVLTILKS